MYLLQLCIVIILIEEKRLLLTVMYQGIWYPRNVTFFFLFAPMSYACSTRIESVNIYLKKVSFPLKKGRIKSIFLFSLYHAVKSTKKKHCFIKFTRKFAFAAPLKDCHPEQYNWLRHWLWGKKSEQYYNRELNRELKKFFSLQIFLWKILLWVF